MKSRPIRLGNRSVLKSLKLTNVFGVAEAPISTKILAKQQIHGGEDMPVFDNCSK
jgi:hypothetical protein